MDIDTDWCIYCNKQTNGSLYCSSQCRMKDEKQSNMGSNMGMNYEETNSAMNFKYCSSESSNSSSSYSNSNYLKYFFNKGNDLKFKNRPSFDTGYYGKKGYKCMQKPWLEKDSYLPILSNKNLCCSNKTGYCHHTGTSSFYSDSDDNVSTTSTIINPNPRFINGKLNIKEHYYPWSSSDEDYDDDDNVSLYEY